MAFLEDMVACGLGLLVLTISDGATGPCAALDQVFPAARWQRCLVHRAQNTIAKASEVDQSAVRADFWNDLRPPRRHRTG